MEKPLISRGLVFMAFLAGLLLALNGGCTSLMEGSKEGSYPDSNPNFSVNQEADFPVPENFHFDKERSFSFITYRDPKGVGSFRSTTCYYYGDHQVANLVPWYLEQMEFDGWTHKETAQEFDKKRLTFVKGDESAVLWLYREFDTRFDRHLTWVMVKIEPTRIEEMPMEKLVNPESREKPTGREQAPALEPAGGFGPATRQGEISPASTEGGSNPIVPEYFNTEKNELEGTDKFIPDDEKIQ